MTERSRNISRIDGPAIAEVTTAITTRATKRRASIKFASRATVARTISTAPRAFIAMPDGGRLTPWHAGKSCAEGRAGDLADARDGDDDRHELPVEVRREVDLQPDRDEEQRCQNANHELTRAFALFEVARQQRSRHEDAWRKNRPWHLRGGDDREQQPAHEVIYRGRSQDDRRQRHPLVSEVEDDASDDGER